MRIEYLAHASLLIDTGDIVIVTDPWLEGTAYCGQWHLFPLPTTPAKAADADAVLISHAHEDHLHGPTLRHMPRDKPVLFPFYWDPGGVRYLRSLGFSETVETFSMRTVSLTSSTSVTSLSLDLDSIFVIEADGEVLVNVNDVLHARPDSVIDLYTNHILQRWPKIDVVFCGFGGANNFPNTIHCPGKDDRGVGAVREQVFVEKFCRIVRNLAPRVAVPFAADFALLREHQRWINEIRIPKETVERYFMTRFRAADSDTTVYAMYPGDVLCDATVQASSPYREQLRGGSLNHLIADRGGRPATSTIGVPEASSLGAEIVEHVNRRSQCFESRTLPDFCLRIEDLVEDNCYNLLHDGNRYRLVRSAEVSASCEATVDIGSGILRHCFGSVWGGDAIVVGYGCELHLSRAAASAGVHKLCTRLLINQPVRSYQESSDARAVAYREANPLSIEAARIGNGDRKSASAMYGARWLLESADTLRRVFGLPGESMNAVQDRLLVEATGS